MKYINQLGTKTLENNQKREYLCTSCKHNVRFYKIPSFKTVKRCRITGCKTENLQFLNCKHYNSKPKSGFVIGV